MKILIACEYSGRVRDAFIAQGHDAISCDLLPTERTGPHHQGNVLDIINDGFDLMIAHPPCTDLAVSGAKWFAKKRADGSQQRSIDFFMALVNASIPRICIENPIGIMSSVYRKPSQIIQPWQFGHPESKATCLWIKGLPLLTTTNNVYDEMMALPKNKRMRLHYLPPSKDRWKIRSQTFQGIADAMASRWGVACETHPISLTA